MFNKIANASMRPTRSRGGITAEIADALVGEPNGTVIFVPFDSGYSGEPQSLYHVTDALGFGVAVQPTVDGVRGITVAEFDANRATLAHDAAANGRPLAIPATYGWLIARKPRTAKRIAQTGERNGG